MGIDNAALTMFKYAKRNGTDFSRTITLGRQLIYANPASIKSAAEFLGLSAVDAASVTSGTYAEPLFQALGARVVDSLDASSYEGATIVHDLNLPLPTELHKKYSLVIDCGTIEHVFNAPQAFKSAMQMVELGGHIIQINVANNYMGHGFWQFSPDLIHRIYSPENGYEIQCLLIREEPNGHMYSVADPAALSKRVELVNDKRTIFLTLAKRTSIVEIFAQPPQQSFYEDIWTGDEAIDSGNAARPKDLARRFVPSRLKQMVRDIRRKLRLRSEWLDDTRAYAPLSEDDLLSGRFRQK